MLFSASPTRTAEGRPLLYYAACCQTDHAHPRHRDEMEGVTTRLIEQLENTVVGYQPFHDVRLVVFPEFAHAGPIYETAEEIAEKLAVEIPNPHTDRLAKVAQKHKVWIQSGSFLEIDPRWPDAVFNTTVLISPDGEILTRYRKVNPWIPWEVHTSPHDLPGYDEPLFPVADTEIGKLGVATCYDWLFPETCRELTLGGAEVLIRISAYMDPWGATEPLDWWTLINRSRAVENLAAVVACNQGASADHYPPFSWPGASMIVDMDGRVMTQAAAGPGQASVVGPVALGQLREERRRRQGHSMPMHLRTEAYPLQRETRYPGNPEVKQRQIRALNDSIRSAKEEQGW